MTKRKKKKPIFQYQIFQIIISIVKSAIAFNFFFLYINLTS